MHLLNGGGLPTLLRCREEYPHAREHLGRLARPRHISRLRETLNAGFKTGVDNEVFCGWDEARFINQIARIEEALYGRVLTIGERFGRFYVPKGWNGTTADTSRVGVLPYAPLPATHPNLLFVTVPDVVGDARATAERWSQWAPLMSHLPLALCVQDGAEDVGIPWSWPGLRCLFMAGTDSFKLSKTLADICREGKRRGLHIHGGRVNSCKRIRYMKSLGCVDSVDGSGFDKYRDTHLGWALQEVAATSRQELLSI
jgi:hypothetical protein